MAGVKGCTNSKCVAVKKKITYKESEDFCSKCGGPLSYVCKKCYTPIGKKDKLCAIHQAEKEGILQRFHLIFTLMNMLLFLKI